jgi:HK97 family phage major capsid protein
MFGDTKAARWCSDYGLPVSQRVLTGLSGGESVLVPEELSSAIISLREQYGIARRLCYVHPMASDTAIVPRDTGDVTAYFVGREEAPTANDPTFDNVTLTARNIAAETRLSNDFADDSMINLADYVADKHARAFAIKEDECLINGDGTSTYGGIVGIRPGILGLAGAVDAASGHDLFSEITATDLRSVMAAAPDLPGFDPVWLTSKAGQNLMFERLADAAGGNNKLNLASAMRDQWGGYPIVTSPAMPTTTGDQSDVVMAVFGDLRMGAIFGDRRGINMMVDPYSLSSYQQVKIISSLRFDINVHGLGSSTAAGPIVALIGE